MPDRPTLAEVRTEIARELRMRERVYPRRVADGQMTRADAERQTARLRAALDYLPEPEPERDLFSGTPKEASDA